MQETVTKPKTSPTSSSNQSPTQNSDSNNSGTTDFTSIDPELVEIIREEEEKDKERMADLGTDWVKLSFDAFDAATAAAASKDNKLDGSTLDVTSDKMDLDGDNGYVSLWDEMCGTMGTGTGDDDDEAWNNMDWDKALRELQAPETVTVA